MKYLKKFNESLMDDSSFCGECGTQLNTSDVFCGECGTQQDEGSTKSFTISGIIEASYPNGQKTPKFTLSSMNKTLSGTNIIFDRSINKYEVPTGEEVEITGTTQDGLPPKFDNPIIVSSLEDIKK